jgi:hypothetical protein
MTAAAVTAGSRVADRYTSLIGLRLQHQVDDLGAVVVAAGASKDLDRAAPVGAEGARAQQVYWGGRMERAVVRAIDDDGPVLRAEAYVGAEGLLGIQRQIQLLQGLARHVPGQVTGVWDASARVDHEPGWLHRVAVGGASYADAVHVVADGEGTWWARTHGAARLDVPDLELYGLDRGLVDAAAKALEHVHAQLLDRGLKTDLTLLDGTPVYLVPVLEAWQHLPFDWAGVGRAGRDRGPGLDGPRASLSILHRPRLGRYKRDFEGVLDALRG